jgi:hypothetical protein
MDHLEAVVEVPCRLPSYATYVHCAEVVAQISPQYSWSVPLTKFLYMYHNLIQRWSVMRSYSIRSLIFTIFSGVKSVDGCPERSSSSVDVRLFLKRLYLW